ncbi:hypothetical protein D9M68_504390 [compost metagenome]
MVIEPAGFLAFQHRGLELHAVLFQGDPLGHHAERGVDVTLQAFGVTGAGVVLPEHAAGFEHLHQGVEHGGLVALHGGGGELYHENVAEAVHHQAGEQVGIAIDQAVERLVEEALAQAQGDVDAVHQQGLVQAVLDVAGHQARADQVVRGEGDHAQRLAAGGFKDGLVTRLEKVQRGGDHVHFVAVDPQVAGAQASIGIGFEAQAGQGHVSLSGKKAGIIPQPAPAPGAARRCLRRPGTKVGIPAQRAGATG